MTKKMTAWVKLREILIFLLIWPILPLIITNSGLLNTFYGSFTYVLIILMFIYNFLGWYIAARVYAYRTKKYAKPENQIYSLKKEIGFFILIWPVGPILTYVGLYLIEFTFQVDNIAIFMGITTYWLMFGWGLALYIYNRRRKKYFQNHINEQTQKKNKIGRFIPLLIVLIILGTIAFFVIKMISDFVDDGHCDFAPSGTKIRLEISEDECQKYPNRYYFRNLCILCPNELNKGVSLLYSKRCSFSGAGISNRVFP